MRAADRYSPLHRYFAGLAEHTFHTHLGMADAPLVTYLTQLLLRFSRTDTLYKIRDLAGRRLEEIAMMLAEAEARVGDARRQVHCHIGDYSLFWLGVFPEALERKGDAAGMSSMYMEMGKRSYFIASTIRADGEEDVPCDVLERLSARFELCAFGLREVRREWENRDEDFPDGLLLN